MSTEELRGSADRARRAETDLEVVGRVPSRWLDRWAEQRPDDVAVTHRGVAVTYTELLARTNAYTGAVLQRTNGKPAIVPIVMPTDIDAMAATYGVQRAGGVVVPIDTAEAPERRDTVLAQIDAAVILARDEASIAGVDRSADRLFSAEVDESSADDGIDVQVTDPARIIFTSGSTGTPKGVITSHQVIADHAALGVEVDNYTFDDRLSLVHSLSFAASTRPTYGSLLAGARVCLFDVRNDPLTDLGPWVGAEHITVLHMTPNLLRTMLAITDGDDFLRSVRLIRLGADRTLPDDLREAQRRMPDSCRVLIGYASTEVGMISATFFDKTAEVPDVRIPLGRPFPSVVVRMVDEHGKPVPDGEAGAVEVAPSGPTPELFTDVDALFNPTPFDPDAPPRFVANGDRGMFLPDGQIDLVGRATARVKIRGFGVDMTEVEQALTALPGVELAAVVLEPDSKAPRLVAHLVASGAPVELARIRSQLRDALPEYAIPGLVRWWDALPLTSRAKLDRSAMVEASRDLAADSESPEPTDELEAGLITIWQRVLELRGVGVDDNFFDIGGDSLSAYELVAAIQSDLDLDIAPASLLEAPTVRSQAELIRTGGGSRGNRLVSIRPVDAPGPVFFVHGGGGGVLYGVRLAESLADDRPVYGLQVDDPAWLDEVETLADLAEIYTAELLSTEPTGPITIVGWSFGGPVAWDMGLRLEELGLDVGEIVILDSRIGHQRNLIEWQTSKSFHARRRLHRFGGRTRDVLDDPKRAAGWLLGRTRRPSDPDAGDEPEPIRDALGTISREWTPGPARFPVSVLGVEGTGRFHRTVWESATSGPFTLELVSGARHYDLMASRRRRTAAFLRARLALTSLNKETSS